MTEQDDVIEDSTEESVEPGPMLIEDDDEDSDAVETTEDAEGDL